MRSGSSVGDWERRHADLEQPGRLPVPGGRAVAHALPPMEATADPVPPESAVAALELDNALHVMLAELPLWQRTTVFVGQCVTGGGIRTLPPSPADLCRCRAMACTVGLTALRTRMEASHR